MWVGIWNLATCEFRRRRADRLRATRPRALGAQPANESVATLRSCNNDSMIPMQGRAPLLLAPRSDLILASRYGVRTPSTRPCRNVPSSIASFGALLKRLSRSVVNRSTVSPVRRDQAPKTKLPGYANCAAMDALMAVNTLKNGYIQPHNFTMAI
jgi:hypothetical protein